MEGMCQLSNFWLSENSGSTLRDRVDFLIGHALLARGESRRVIDLPNMLTLELPDEGPQNRTPLVIIMSRGKTNQHGRIEYGAAMRCKEEMVFPLGAVAMHLFWRWQIDLEAFPDVVHRERWYNIHLVNGADVKKEISYNTQLTRVKRAFLACGIDSSVWTHSNRGSGAKLAETYGASEEQIRRLGRWNAARMEGCYLTSLPKKAMRSLASFPTKGGGYWLRRGSVVPGVNLQQMVYPEVETATVKLAASPNTEIAGGAFLKMLKDMRVVFLQDSVIPRRNYPNHRLWSHKVFQTPEYTVFEREMNVLLPTFSEPVVHTLQTVVPQIAAAMKAGFETLNGRIDALAAGVETPKDLSHKRLVLRWEDVNVSTQQSSASTMPISAANTKSKQNTELMFG